MLLRYWIGNLQINPVEYFEVFQPLKLQGWKLSLKNSQISWFVGLLTSQEVSSSFKKCSFVCNYWHNISIAQHCVYLKEFSFLTWFFILFQVFQQFPFSFEFTEKFLIMLADNCYSSNFGTFLCDSDYERNLMNVQNHTGCRIISSSFCNYSLFSIISAGSIIGTGL